MLTVFENIVQSHTRGNILHTCGFVLALTRASLATTFSEEGLSFLCLLVLRDFCSSTYMSRNLQVFVQRIMVWPFRLCTSSATLELEGLYQMSTVYLWTISYIQVTQSLYHVLVSVAFSFALSCSHLDQPVFNKKEMYAYHTKKQNVYSTGVWGIICFWVDH